MREKNVRALSAIGVLVLAGTTVLAGGNGGDPGSITDGDSSYTFLGFDSNGQANWQPGGGDVSGNQLFQSWWWYRADDQNSETAFGQGFPDNTVYSGDTATFSGNENDAPDPIGLVWDMTWTVSTGILPALNSTISVTNTTNDPIVLNIFHYGDIDLNGSGSDTATVNDNGDVIVVSDSGTPGATIQYAGDNPDAFQVDVQDDLLELLNDDEITNLTNVNNVTVPADFTAGFQWIDVVLLPGESEEFSIGFVIVPAPGATAILGLAGLGAFRRRR